MSLNIQTPNGLLEIGGKVTKEKVISALEYTPANETHVEDENIHVSAEDRQNWDNKSDFSGSYADLIDAPGIAEDDSGDMIVVDNNGNIIMKVDAEGISTTNVNTKTVNLNGEDLATKLDSIESKTSSNIIDDESQELVITDESGNIIVRIDENGLETTTVTAYSIIVNGIDVEAELKKPITDHSHSVKDITDLFTVAMVPEAEMEAAIDSIFGQ